MAQSNGLSPLRPLSTRLYEPSRSLLSTYIAYVVHCIVSKMQFISTLTLLSTIVAAQVFCDRSRQCASGLTCLRKLEGFEGKQPGKCVALSCIRGNNEVCKARDCNPLNFEVCKDGKRFTNECTALKEGIIGTTRCGSGKACTSEVKPQCVGGIQVAPNACEAEASGFRNFAPC
jgi:hypothetical protein